MAEDEQRDARMLAASARLALWLREFWDGPRIYAVLDTIHALYTIDCIIHGGARGADRLRGVGGAARLFLVIT